MVTKTARKPKSKSSKAPAKQQQAQLCCDECGLVLSVDQPCGCEDLSSVMCCEQPMRQRKKK